MAYFIESWNRKGSILEKQKGNHTEVLSLVNNNI
jgi:hypothetical protein